jgi:hypothetical protein
MKTRVYLCDGNGSNFLNFLHPVIDISMGRFGGVFLCENGDLWFMSADQWDNGRTLALLDKDVTLVCHLDLIQ